MSLSLPPQIFITVLIDSLYSWAGACWLSAPLKPLGKSLLIHKLLWNSLIENKTQNPELPFFFLNIFYFLWWFSAAVRLEKWKFISPGGTLQTLSPLSAGCVSQPGSGSAGVTFLVITSLALCICNNTMVPWTVLLEKSLYFISEMSFPPVSNLPELGACSSKGFSWLLGKSFHGRRNGALDASSKEVKNFGHQGVKKRFR